jgi:hypothetical protein
MPATEQKVSLKRGDSRTLTFGPVRDESGVVVDLTGVTITWEMGRFAVYSKAGVLTAPRSPLVTKTIGSGVTVTDAVGGLFQVTLASTDTKTLAPDDYYHEAEITEAGGAVYTTTEGRFVLLIDLANAP